MYNQRSCGLNSILIGSRREVSQIVAAMAESCVIGNVAIILSIVINYICTMDSDKVEEES